MAEKPILFSTPMVQAILDKRKNMTRRLNGLQEINKNPDDWQVLGYCRNPVDDDGKVLLGDYAVFGKKTESLDEQLVHVKCPYSVGTKLYVRETWKCIKYNNMDGNLGYGVEFKDGTRKYFEFDDNERFHQFGKFAFKDGWQSPWFMPKEAARIWLEVTNVRVERLYDITDEDAQAEGISYDTAMEYSGWSPSFNDPDGSNAWPNYTEAYKDLWDSLNASRGYPFDSNCWVWAITFKREEG